MIERNDGVIWPSHIGEIHPNLRAHLKAVAVEDLLPFQVDYVLATLLDLPEMELHYMPDLKWASVHFSSDKKLWAPTQDIDQARRAAAVLPGTEIANAARNLSEIFRGALAAAGHEGFRIPYPQSFDH